MLKFRWRTAREGKTCVFTRTWSPQSYFILLYGYLRVQKKKKQILPNDWSYPYAQAILVARDFRRFFKDFKWCSLDHKISHLYSNYSKTITKCFVINLDKHKHSIRSGNLDRLPKSPVGILSQIKLLFGPLVIQLVWYILKQLFTSVSVKVVYIYLHFGGGKYTPTRIQLVFCGVMEKLLIFNTC